MRRIIPTAIAFGAIAAAIASTGAAGQSPAASVFTLDQAAAGKATFTKLCASCHLADLTGNDDAPALAGSAFRDLWKTRSTKELFDYMSGAMPPGGSSLNAADYSAIVAFILERNGAAAGAEPFTPATAVPIGSVIR